MDLSGMIFAALAIGWAVYLIPKALQHTDDVAVPRSVESFSERMRVVGGVKKADPAPVSAPVAAPVTRAAAKRAAARRRRVLYVLLGLTAIVGGLVAAAVVPLWSIYIPVGMIVTFLVIARMSVKRAQSAAAPVASSPAAPVAPAVSGTAVADDVEDTVDVPRADLDAALAQAPVADEGSLWDPLPVTLPTYVGKPAARRTVRTIELTQGKVTSSGHNAGDSAMVRENEAAKAEAAEAETQEKRRAAGA